MPYAQAHLHPAKAFSPANWYRHPFHMHNAEPPSVLSLMKIVEAHSRLALNVETAIATEMEPSIKCGVYILAGE